MSNNKYDAVFFDPKPGKERKTEARHAGARRRPTPVWAKLVAAALLLGVLAVAPVSCAVQGAAYDACIQKIAQEQGHEAAVYEMNNGGCK